jgi:hypothetical protein
MAKGVRKSITIPGLLAATLKERYREFGHSIFTPYAVERLPTARSSGILHGAASSEHL